MLPERRQLRSDGGRRAEGHRQMLVDVGIDGQHGAAAHEVTGDHGGERRLAAATLADEGDLHR
ncbi:hypothetical protein [Micromonospora sp. WMMD980]|uniref:hypothetical protein n=1 Tax=Micromonospora sp. WMMD980 TaxID=3016088 RepID=UPI0024173B2D|nr:hypothetical protein [Micromonospora sp. WMMD980]MDG4799956.1 hypothetical protein [Micromonospora sp. WMMD980]